MLLFSNFMSRKNKKIDSTQKFIWWCFPWCLKNVRVHKFFFVFFYFFVYFFCSKFLSKIFVLLFDFFYYDIVLLCQTVVVVTLFKNKFLYLQENDSSLCDFLEFLVWFFEIMKFLKICTVQFYLIGWWTMWYIITLSSN